MRTRLDYRSQKWGLWSAKIEIFQNPSNNSESKKSTLTNQEDPKQETVIPYCRNVLQQDTKLPYEVLPTIPNIFAAIHETKLNEMPIDYVVIQNPNENWSFLHLPENVYSSFIHCPGHNSAEKM